MSVDRKEIDLIIRAAVQGQNNLPAVTKSIADLEKAITSQAAAAKRGEVSIDELKSTLLALQQAQDKLKDQAGLIGQFQKLAEQVAKATDKAEKAVKTQSDFQAKLDATGKSTEIQTERLNKYAAATERAQQAVSRQKDQQASLQKVLAQSGIDVNNLATSETTLRTSAAQLGLAINKSQQSIASFATDVRAARDAEKEFADTKAFEKQSNEAAKLVRASEYVKFWETALNKADTAQKEFANNDSLRKSADEAVAAARGYLTLGRAISTITAPGPSLGNTIKGIIDPAKQARSSLSGIESELDKVKTSINAITGPVEEYSTKLRELSNIQKSIQGKSSLVDDYQRQVTALRAARSEFSSSRKEVLLYAETLRTFKGDNTALLNSLAQSKSKLSGSASVLKQEVIATRELREELKQAGIATKDLTGSQVRLTTAAKGSVAALTSLTDNYKKYGESVKKAESGHSLFNNSGRTTLSLLQRFKGELLAATSAYIGFYGVIGNGNKILDAYSARQAIQSQLAISVGNDAAKIAEEYAYVQIQAERLGISFESLATGYAKFLASGTLAGRSRNELRVIFESFSEVGRVANLTKENMDGVFKALEQVLSKGSIQAEELRGQLGDRLFGAFQVAADALKSEFPDLNKAMKDGIVTSDQLIRIAEKYREIVAAQLPTAVNSLAAQQDRLTTSIFNFKTLIADSGFADAFKEFVTKLSAFFKSEDGTKFAKNLAKAFTTLSNALLFLLDNIDSLVLVGKVLVTLYGFKFMVGAVAGVVQFYTEIKTATGLVSGLNGVLGALTLGMIAFHASSAAFDKWDGYAKFFISFNAGLQKFYAYLTTGSKVAFSSFIDAGKSMFISSIQTAFKYTSELVALFAKVSGFFGANELAKKLDKEALKLSIVAKLNIKIDDKSTNDAKAKLKREIEQINRDRDLGYTEVENRNKVVADANLPATGTESDGTKTGKSNGKKVPTEAELAKAASKIESLFNEIAGALNTLEDSVDKKGAVTLKEKLDAIETNYTNLALKISKLNKLSPGKGDDFAVRLEKDKQALILQETKKFNDDLAQQKETLESNIEAIEAQAGKKEKDNLDVRLAAIVKSQADKYREIQTFRDLLVANNNDTTPADNLKLRLDNATEELKLLETKQFYLDGIASREQALNNLVAERTSRINTLNIQQEAGLLSQTQVWDQSKAIIDELQPKISALVTEGKYFAETIPLAFSPELVAEFSANLLEADSSSKKLRTTLFETSQVTEMLASGATTAFDTSAENIGDAITGAKSWGEAILGVRDAFLNYAADFLRQIALMMIKQQLLNALQSMGGSEGGGFIGAAVSVLNGVMHDGGVVNGSVGRTRSVDTSMFIGAPRYHKGGIAGLAPDEYPTILQKNEEVLKKSDPRNVLNGGLNRGESQPQNNQTTRIVNVIDPAMAGEYMQSSAGEKVLMNFISRNKSGIRSSLA